MDPKAGGMGIGVDDVIQFIEAALPVVKSIFGLDATNGGQLGGAPDQLQPLNAHGGEYVVNSNAAKAFQPQLEQMNASVPPDPSVQPEMPMQGPSFYTGGGDSAGGESAADTGGGDTGTGAAADSGVGIGDAGTGPAQGDPVSGVGMAADAAGMSPADATTGTGTSATSPSPDAGPPASDAAGATAPAATPPGSDPDDPTLNITPYNLDTNRGGFRAAAKGAFGFGLTPGQKAMSSLISLVPGTPPGTKGALGAGFGAANNAINNHAAAMFGVSPDAVSPGMAAVAAASIAGQVAGVQGDATAGNAGMGGPDSSSNPLPSVPQIGPSAPVQSAQTPRSGFNVSPIFNSGYRGTENSSGLSYDDTRRTNGFRVGV